MRIEIFLGTHNRWWLTIRCWGIFLKVSWLSSKQGRRPAPLHLPVRVFQKNLPPSRSLSFPQSTFWMSPWPSRCCRPAWRRLFPCREFWQRWKSVPAGVRFSTMFLETFSSENFHCYRSCTRWTMFLSSGSESTWWLSMLRCLGR